MPIANTTYVRGPESKVKGKQYQAQRDKVKFTQNKFSIRFHNNGVEFEHTSKKG